MNYKVINIWEKSQQKFVKELPKEVVLTTYLLAGEKPRGLILVLPGGGYSYTSPREAEPIALKFNSAGYHAVVLDYSCSPSRFPQAVLDAARALTLVRENAKEWNVDLEKLFVCGFSAGGHLAASISNMYLESWLHEYEDINLQGIQLRGSILSYPVLTAGIYRHEGSFDNLLGNQVSEDERLNYSMEDLVNKNTPETFIWHTVEDKSVPVENTLLYVVALQKMAIPYECHIYPHGSHGISLATQETATDKEQINPHVASWINLCCEWIYEIDK